MNKICRIFCIMLGTVDLVLIVPITIFLDKIVSIQTNMVVMILMTGLGILLTAEGLADMINSAIDERLYNR